MKRYTDRDAKACFERVVSMQGKRVAKSYNDVGAWQLDCNWHYNGCRIEQISSSSGGITEVTQRLPPRQFCEAVWFSEGIARKHANLGRRKRR